MGKRKAAKKPVATKKKDQLPTNFQCLFCNHEKSVAVRMDKKAGTGFILCKVCGQDWSTSINFLSAPVDVYADWVDACDEAAKNAGRSEQDHILNRRDQPAPTSKVAGPAGGGSGDEMDDFIENDEMDAEGEFGD